MNIENSRNVQNTEAAQASFFYEEQDKIRNFKNNDILSSAQFDKDNLQLIFEETDKAKDMVNTNNVASTLSSNIIATLFYEPSTRTRLSFESATLKLGGSIISESSARFSSAYKGEMLEDTIKVVSDFADLIVLRHKDEGSAKIAADCTQVPLINAGDGQGEHPTQALCDIYTIKSKFAKLDGITITFLGDLKHGRTVHSLSMLLSNYNVNVNFVAPEFIQIPDSISNLMAKNNIKINKVNQLSQLSDDFDVIYVTRLQEERFTDEFAQQKLAHLRNSYDLTENFTEKSRAFIMHPLPRQGEISTTLDKNEKSIYFEQSKNGLYVRMALLKLLLKG